MKITQQKILLISLACSSFILSGCLGVDNSSSNSSSSGTTPIAGSTQVKVYNNNQFTFNFPADWEIIQPKDFTSEVPHETQVVARNNIKNDTFTANVNVVRNDIQNNSSTLDYAKEILNRQKTGLLDYKETKREIIKVSIGGQDQESYYVEFEARLHATEPVNKFIQTFGVKDKSGFIIMGAFSLQEQTAIVNKISDIIKSFKVD